MMDSNIIGVFGRKDGELVQGFWVVGDGYGGGGGFD